MSPRSRMWPLDTVPNHTCRRCGNHRAWHMYPNPERDHLFTLVDAPIAMTKENDVDDEDHELPPRSAKKNANRKTPKGRTGDPRPCSICGKPKTNHRGSIGHQYAPVADEAKPAEHAADRFAAGGKSPIAIDEKLAKVLALARQRDELEEDLALVTQKLTELLA